MNFDEICCRFKELDEELNKEYNALTMEVSQKFNKGLTIRDCLEHSINQVENSEDIGKNLLFTEILYGVLKSINLSPDAEIEKISSEQRFLFDRIFPYLCEIQDKLDEIWNLLS